MVRLHSKEVIDQFQIPNSEIKTTIQFFLDNEAFEKNNDYKSTFSKESEIHILVKKIFRESFEKLRNHFGAIPSTTKGFLLKHIYVFYCLYHSFGIIAMEDISKITILIPIDQTLYYFRKKSVNKIRYALIHELLHHCNTVHHNEELIKSRLKQFGDQKIIAEREFSRKIDLIESNIVKQIRDHGSIPALTETTRKYFLIYFYNFYNIILDLGIGIVISEMKLSEYIDVEIHFMATNYLPDLEKNLKYIHRMKKQFKDINTLVEYLDFVFALASFPCFIIPYLPKFKTQNGFEKRAKIIIDSYFSIIRKYAKHLSKKMRFIYNLFIDVIDAKDFKPSESVERQIHNQLSVEKAERLRNVIWEFEKEFESKLPKLK